MPPLQLPPKPWPPSGGCSPDLATPGYCAEIPWYFPRPTACASCSDFDAFMALYDGRRRIGKAATPLEQFELLPAPARFAIAAAVVITIYNTHMSASHRRRYGPNAEAMPPPQPFSIVGASDGFVPRLVMAAVLTPGLAALSASLYSSAPPRRFPALVAPEDREVPPYLLDDPRPGEDLNAFVASRYGRTRGWDFRGSSAQHTHLLFYITVVLTYVLGESLGSTTIAEEDSPEISAALGVAFASVAAFAIYMHLGPLAGAWVSDLVPIGMLSLCMVTLSYMCWAGANLLGTSRVPVGPPPPPSPSPDAPPPPPRQFRVVKRQGTIQLALVGLIAAAAALSVLCVIYVELSDASSYVDVGLERGQTREVFGAEGRAASTARGRAGARLDLEVMVPCSARGRKAVVTRSPAVTGNAAAQLTVGCAAPRR